MPKRDGTGPPPGSTGTRKGQGGGKGTWARKGQKGIGRKKGGKKGSC